MRILLSLLSLLAFIISDFALATNAPYNVTFTIINKTHYPYNFHWRLGHCPFSIDGDGNTQFTCSAYSDYHFGVIAVIDVNHIESATLAINQDFSDPYFYGDNFELSQTGAYHITISDTRWHRKPHNDVTLTIHESPRSKKWSLKWAP